METVTVPKELLKRIAGYVDIGGVSFNTNAVYITPAQQLRNQANMIEQKERDIAELNSLIAHVSM